MTEKEKALEFWRTADTCVSNDCFCDGETTCSSCIADAMVSFSASRAAEKKLENRIDFLVGIIKMVQGYETGKGFTKPKAMVQREKTKAGIIRLLEGALKTTRATKGGKHGT